MEQSSDPNLTNHPSRRRLIAAIAAGGSAVMARGALPDQWGKPLVESVLLPAHAQTTAEGDTEMQEFSEAAPISVAAAGPAGGLSTPFRRSAPGDSTSRLAQVFGNGIVPTASAQEGPIFEDVEARAYVAVQGDVAELVQLHVTEYFRCTPEGELNELELLLEYFNVPIDGGLVNVGNINCPFEEFESSARVVSDSTGLTLIIEVGGAGTAIPLVPGGTPFTGVPSCLDQELPTDCEV